MPLLGTRLTDKYVANERPEVWRNGIFDQYPDSVPLQLIMDRTKPSVAEDYKVHWFQRKFATRELTVNAGDTPGIETAGANDTMRVGTGEAYNACIGSLIWNPAAGEVVLVYGVVDGENLQIVRGIGASGSMAAWTAGDKAQVTTTAYSEIAGTPEAVMFDPTEYWNYSQVVRTACRLSFRAKAVKLRTGDAMKRHKKDALKLHMRELEWMFITGVRAARTAGDGSLQTFSGGLLDPNIGFSTNVLNVSSLAGGALSKKALNQFIGQIAEQSDTDELMLICGGGAALNLDEMAEAYSFQFAEVGKQDSFGMTLTAWKTQDITVYIHRHRLMTRNSHLKWAGFFIAPEQLSRFHLAGYDTDYYKIPRTSGATVEIGEYMTDTGMQIVEEYKGGYLKNFQNWV